MASLLVIAILLTFPALGAAEPPETARDSGSLMAPHGEVGRFFNPWEQTPKKSWGFLRWKLLSRNSYDKKRPPVIPRVPNDGANLSGVAPSPTLTWVGHATYAIEQLDTIARRQSQNRPRMAGLVSGQANRASHECGNIKSDAASRSHAR